MARLEQLQKLLAAEPRDVFVNFALAMEYLKADRHEEALAQFGRVSEIDPDYVAAYFQKGNSLVAMGRREEAKAVLQRGVEVARRTGNSHAADEMTELLETLGGSASPTPPPPKTVTAVSELSETAAGGIRNDGPVIDLRSDTVTRPTAAMRQAMAAAEVGDDVFGDDPTVMALERRVAEILGKEAAVFMPSGTMTNQVAVRAHTEPGDEILLEAEAHIYYYEAGGPAALSGVMCRLLEGERGIFTAEEVKAALRPRNLHFPPTRLLCIENTHNRGGGSVWPVERIAEVAGVAREAGLRLHLDGARLWNASVATGVSEREYAKYFDSVSVCFSKGLGAPVGSALAGSGEFIARARRFRKQFGGGMRQAGIIAAGALYALEHHRARMADDHANAKVLAQGLASIPGIELVGGMPETNIVMFRVKTVSADTMMARLKEAGLWVTPRSEDSMRAVTHLDVTAEQVRQAVQIVRQVMAGAK